MKVSDKFEQDTEGQWWYRAAGRRFRAETAICPCGESFVRSKAKTQGSDYCSRSCASKYTDRAKAMQSGPGESHHNWKGGRYKDKNGYVRIYAPDHPSVQDKRVGLKYVWEHRLVMEKHLGRLLHAHETVHHINTIRDDNRIENLQLRQGKHGKGGTFRCRCCGSRDIEAIEL